MSSPTEPRRTPEPANVPVLSIAPILLNAPERGADLQIRVSAPGGSGALPVILFSHGNGQSHHAYGPLVDHWAAQGFAVIQPTHLDSRRFGLSPDDPRRAQLWRWREDDLVRVLDNLDCIERETPFLRGRIDRDRLAVAGHSWGAQTASTLLGATHPDPDDGSTVNRKDPRIKAGVLLTVPGRGGTDLTEQAARAFPFMHADFSAMTTPALIVAGDRDQSRLTTRGPEWWRDAYDLSPSPKALFTAFGAEHSLGGIPGYESRETTDERSERLAAIQRLSTAFLRSALYPDSTAWETERTALASCATPEGRIETK